MSKQFAGSLALAFVVGCCQWVIAQQDQRPQRDAALFDRIDANKDGVLSEDEVSEDRKSFFERLVRNNDKNNDGKVSREEFAAGTADPPRRPEGDQPGGPRPPGGRPDPERAFGMMDRNSDGSLSKDEFKAGMEAMARMMGRPDAPGGAPGAPGAPGTPGGFGGRPGGPPNFANAPFFRALDANGDGKIVGDELAKAGDALKTLDRNNDGVLTPEELAPMPPGGFAGRPGEPGRPDGRPGQPGGPPQDTGTQAMLQRLKQADTNGDGKLSKDEAPDRIKENFDRIDTNKDGYIDQAEAGRLADRPGQGRPGQGRPGRPEDAPRRRPQQGENKDN